MLWVFLHDSSIIHIYGLVGAELIYGLVGAELIYGLEGAEQILSMTTDLVIICLLII